jgi:ketosteroid isomerase-like protein
VSKENVELVRGLQPSPDVDLVQMFGNNGKGMLDALKPFFHDDVVIGGDVFGSAPEREGLEGLKEGWADWLEPWETYRAEIEDVIDAGEEVVVLTRDYGRRAGMSTEVSVMGASVWTVRDGKVARARFFADREAGLRAAGLRD